jgi:hypothetical protein
MLKNVTPSDSALRPAQPAASAKFGLHLGNKKFDTQKKKEELYV